MENFLQRLQTLQGDISTAAFARQLGVNQKTLDHLVKGQRKPSVEMVVAICSRLNVSADWLLGLKEKRGGVSATNSTVAAYGSSVTGGDCARCPLMQAAKAAMSSPPSRRARAR